MVKASTRTDLDPIDRLEEKMKQLVAVAERLKVEHQAAVAECARLSAEVESARTLAAANEPLAAELTTLKEEREVIRTRVGEMLDQLEALSL